MECLSWVYNNYWKIQIVIIAFVILSIVGMSRFDMKDVGNIVVFQLYGISFCLLVFLSIILSTFRRCAKV